MEEGKEYFEQIETEDHVIPNFYELKVVGADGQEKVLTVEVEKATQEMPYLGGYRSKKTAAQYLHAGSNTDQYRKEYKEKLTREVQTYQYRTRSTKMHREMGSQMDKTGVVFVDPREDKAVDSQPYFDSEMWLEQRQRATLFIQRNVRGWFARKRAAALRQERDSRDRLILEREEEMRKREEENHEKEIQRRLNPKSQEDFSTLYKELNAYRLKETERIKSRTDWSSEKKQLGLKELLHKETKLLQTIDRLKITAAHQNREERIKQLLGDMAAPKRFKRPDGRVTEVHTLFSTRAKELMDLYHGLKMPMLTIDERLDVLLHTKWTVKEFDCNLSREIVDLIDREADMLNRGRPEGSLDGLRKRLANLFLQFIETPEFNPEAARFQKVPEELVQSALELNFS